MTCEELVDDEVETFVYRPRSYIEENPALDVQYHNASGNVEHTKNPKEKVSPKPSSGSWNDLRNNVMNIVGTPLGRRRSKTIVQRCESVGDRLKSALNRTASLDVLGSKLLKPVHKHHKSMEEDLMKGFSKLTDKAMSSHTKVESLRKGSHGSNENTNIEKPNNENMRGKDRSYSCPTYPTIVEEDLRTVVKSSSYNTDLKCRTVQENGDEVPHYPTIKVELVEDAKNLNKLMQRKNSGKWSTTSASTGSLYSANTDSGNEYISSDNSSVFASEYSCNLHNRAASLGDNKNFEGRLYSPQLTKRPRSFVDIFKQENVQEIKLDCNRNQLASTPKRSSSEQVINEEYNDVNELPRKHRSLSLLQEIIIESNQEKDVNNEIYDYEICENFDSPRIRARSMIEFRGKNNSQQKTQEPRVHSRTIPVENNNNNNDLVDVSKHNDVNDDEHHKKSRHHHHHNKLYSIASPKSLKKLFKKRRTFPGSNNKSSPKTSPQTTAIIQEETNDLLSNRKCIHIESIV